LDRPDTVRTYLNFEKPIAELENKISELKLVIDENTEESLNSEIGKLEAKAAATLKETYAHLTPWQKTEVARHPQRPHAMDFINSFVEDFTPLAGDRLYANDQAIVGGLGTFEGQSVMVIGHEKGSDTEGRIKHNFGMAMPEGYRKAVRLMEMAEKFSLPIITLIDTAGAYPGIGAEERGQAEAIARSTDCCLKLKVPIVAVIIGEGGSGGAVAIATANKIMMLEHAIYSVISPEGAASIIWRDANKKEEAATAMKITAQDLEGLEIIDTIIPEPVGGAHRDKRQVIEATRIAISQALDELKDKKPEELRKMRHDRFLEMGRTL